MTFTRILALSTALSLPMAAMAEDLEVTHWWTSGGEALAVQELAKALDAQGTHKWVDGAIAGSGGTARPVIVSRILGGDPMAATQLNHGQQAKELIEAGLLLDITDVAEAEGWKTAVNPPALLDACTLDGKIYCAPINIHSTQWLWTNPAAFEKAGVAPATNWADLVAAAPKLREAGILPLAVGSQGWQQSTLFGALLGSLGGPELRDKVLNAKDEAALRGPELGAVFEQLALARDMSTGGNVQDWNLATAKVIEGTAAAQVMGDWAQGEFAAAGKTAGTDYDCLIGLGGEVALDTSGDAFYFPVVDNEARTAAQKDLARLLLTPEVQVAFNLKKGSLPVRGDVDMASANACMTKGLEALKAGKVMAGIDQLVSPDGVNQMHDLMTEFFATPSITAADAQTRFADIILSVK